MPEPFFVTTTFNFDGYAIKAYKGVARGIVVRSPTIARGMLGGQNSATEVLCYGTAVVVGKAG